jgi:enoyl-CoA hydratase/carnithine racemase
VRPGGARERIEREEAGTRQGVISTEASDGVRIVRMAGDANLFDDRFLADLNAALDAVVADDTAHSLVLTGAGKYFSNGFDLEFLGRLQGPELMAFIRDAQLLVARVLTFPVPTVAVVNGHAFGIAAMLAIAHDVRVMRADRGWFCLPEIDLGLPFQPFMTGLLRARLTDLTASEAVLTGRRYTGTEAAAAGIAHEAVAESAMLERAVAIATARSGKGRDITATLKRDLYAPVLSTLA